MKIGLSLSRCVRDIVEEHVDIEDVLVLITRTDFDPTADDQWDSIWVGYNSINPEWGGLEENAVKKVILELWATGKIHQPRKFGARPKRLNYHWLETILPDNELDANPMIKDAWERFQVIAGLSNIKFDNVRG
jgi:hypothetical protein